MAANILEVLNADRQVMAKAARANALQYSWRRSMEIIFDGVYPRALERCRLLAAG
ncbi:MAG: hypothetical protein H0W71_09320 [Sphingomonas sp.]|nr:hypothetical protein [Sphingomonas sp.]